MPAPQMGQPSPGQPSQSPSQPGQPQDQGQQAGGSGGGAISQLIDNIGGGLDHLNQMFAQSKSVGPEDKQLINQIAQLYGKLVQSLNGGGEEQGEAADQSQALGQNVPAEAGGNKGAQPSPF